MSYVIEAELERFQAFADRLKNRFKVENLCDYGFKVVPRSVAMALPAGKSAALAFLGVVHGNEWAGLAVLNGLLAHLEAGTINLDIPVVFMAGNPEAALENKRFLDRDLNRSFGHMDAATREGRRAKAIGEVLRGVGWLLDFHQTTRPSERPFFIFPFHRKSFEFARSIGPRHAIVTHWGKPFSAEGMCSDEFVNVQGGVGLSLELGQNGFDPYQIAIGIDAGLWAIRAVTDQLTGLQAQPSGRAVSSELGPVFTWSEIIPWPDSGWVTLTDGWNNFQEVPAGTCLGEVDGRPLTVAKNGRILFPKYLSKEQQAALTSRPTEICRIMRQIDESELP